MSNRVVMRLGIGAAVVLIGLLVLGILPRLSLQKQLAGQVTSAAATIPIVAVATVQRPTAANTVLLPGTMEALHEGAICLRQTAPSQLKSFSKCSRRTKQR
jgi:hypothetical protein